MLEKKAQVYSPGTRCIHPTDNADHLIFLGLDFTNLYNQFSTDTENEKKITVLTDFSYMF